MRRAVAAMAGSLPVGGLEPSCVLTLRDELLSVLPGKAAEDLASRAVLLGEFLKGAELPLQAAGARAHVHGHCHQKAFGAFDDTLAALRRVPGMEVRPIESSCCGMAGVFGYQAETQTVSRAMAER